MRKAKKRRRCPGSGGADDEMDEWLCENKAFISTVFCARLNRITYDYYYAPLTHDKDLYTRVHFFNPQRESAKQT